MFEDGSFLTMKAAETLCMVFALPEEHIFRKQYRGNRPFKKSHFIRFSLLNLHFYVSLKTVKIHH